MTGVQTCALPILGLKPDAGVLPGTYVEGRFLVEKKDGVIVIPSDVVIYRGNTQSVYIASGDVARSVTITRARGAAAGSS